MIGGLRSGRLTRDTEREMPSPMDGVANLADCMLVLACGLMLSLIVNWNLNLGASDAVEPPEDSTNMTQSVELDQNEENQPQDSSEFEEYGTVYRDPETGELYVKVNS